MCDVSYLSLFNGLLMSSRPENGKRPKKGRMMLQKSKQCVECRRNIPKQLGKQITCGDECKKQRINRLRNARRNHKAVGLRDEGRKDSCHRPLDERQIRVALEMLAEGYTRTAISQRLHKTWTAIANQLRKRTWQECAQTAGSGSSD